MSVNLRHGIDEEKTKHLGPIFNSIDFDVINPPNKTTLERRGNQTQAGTFHIGGKTFNLTIGELERIVETLNIAKTVFWQRYRFGL